VSKSDENNNAQKTISDTLVESEALAQEEDFSAVVIAMGTRKAYEVFGEGAKNPDRDILEVTCELEDKSTFMEPFSMPKGVRSWKNETFKLQKYKKAYGKLPAVGDKVIAVFDKEGYLQVKYDFE
jgi:hypothetical protein